MNPTPRTTQLTIRTQEIYTCAFSADGTRVLVGAEGNPVGLWDAGTGERLSVLDDTTLRAWAVRWSVWQFVISLHVSKGLPIAAALQTAEANPDLVEEWGRRNGVAQPR